MAAPAYLVLRPNKSYLCPQASLAQLVAAIDAGTGRWLPMMEGQQAILHWDDEAHLVVVEGRAR
jgi:hypothetical protein